MKAKAADWIIFGENCRYSMDTDVTGLNNNVIVCGTSGCGKTMSVTEPRLIETKHQSIIVTVTKRRIVEKYTDVFKERGYEIHEINLCDPLMSTVSFDPLAGLSKESDYLHLAKTIVQIQGARLSHDVFWDNATIALLYAEIGCVRFFNPKATLADVLSFNDKLRISNNSKEAKQKNRLFTTSLDEYFEKLEELTSPEYFAVSSWKSFYDLAYETAGCVLGMLNSAISQMFTTDVRKMMEKGETVDFERLASVKSVLFITTSAVNPVLHRFVNVFYSRAFTRLFEFAEEQPDGKLPVPVQVICDDFATGGRVPDFAEYISIFREKLISVIIMIQSQSQLEQIYGKENAITIINNCDTYLYMGGTDPNTAKEISIRIDKPVKDILSMPLEQMYVFRRGREPQETTRYNILADKRYQIITAHYEEMVQMKKLEVQKNSAENKTDEEDYL